MSTVDVIIVGAGTAGLGALYIGAFAIASLALKTTGNIFQLFWKA